MRRAIGRKNELALRQGAEWSSRYSCWLSGGFSPAWNGSSPTEILLPLRPGAVCAFFAVGDLSLACPPCARKPTSTASGWMSAKCQSQTLVVQKERAPRDGLSEIIQNERRLIFGLTPVGFNGVSLDSRKHERRSLRIGDNALNGFGR